MATIRATCPACDAEVQLTTRDVKVQVCKDTNQGSYNYRCPACRLAVAKQEVPRIIDLLVSSGVKMRVWSLPAEKFEALRMSGAPFTPDDILDLHELLDDPDRLSEELTFMVAN